MTFLTFMTFRTLFQKRLSPLVLELAMLQLQLTRVGNCVAIAHLLRACKMGTTSMDFGNPGRCKLLPRLTKRAETCPHPPGIKYSKTILVSYSVSVVELPSIRKGL